MNSRGYGGIGNDDDPTEHGRLCTDADIERLCQQTDSVVKEVELPNGTYKLIYSDVGSNRTVILVAGGTHELFCLDDSFLMPATTINHWRQHKINTIVINPSFPIPWGLPAKISSRFAKKIADKLIFYKKPKESAPDKFFIDIYLKFAEDIHSLLEQTSGEVWLIGHCQSAEALVQYCDIASVKKPSGLVLWNPIWISRKKDPTVAEYFLTNNTFPLFVAQHKHDRCPDTSVELAELIVQQSHATHKKLVLLEGGTDEGLPSFSLGHHGFRGIEQELVQATAEFMINKA